MTTGHDANDGRAERRGRSRSLTFVFTDLKGSVRLKEKFGDEKALELINRHRDHVIQYLGADGGHVSNRAGDGFFLVFETPSAATRFALRLQRRHNADPQLPPVRIGIHQGEVIVTDDAADLDGVEIDTAARIGNLAQPGQVLLSIGAHKSAKAHVRTDDAGEDVRWPVYGEYVLEGLDEPVRIGEAGIKGMSPLRAPPRPPTPADGRPSRPVAVVLLVSGLIVVSVLIPRSVNPDEVELPEKVPEAPTPPLSAKFSITDNEWGRPGQGEIARPARPRLGDQFNLFLETDLPGVAYVFEIRPDGSVAFQHPDPEGDPGQCTPKVLDADQSEPVLFGTYVLNESGQYRYIALLVERAAGGICEDVSERLLPVSLDDSIETQIRRITDKSEFEVIGFDTFVYTAHEREE